MNEGEQAFGPAFTKASLTCTSHGERPVRLNQSLGGVQRFEPQPFGSSLSSTKWLNKNPIQNGNINTLLKRDPGD